MTYSIDHPFSDYNEVLLSMKLVADLATSRKGAKVIGVSPDEPQAIKKFDDKYDLNFTLLGDVDHEVADRYGAWGEKSMYGKKYMGMLRSTFIIDPKGKVARVFPKVQPKKHDALVLKALDELAG